MTNNITTKEGLIKVLEMIANNAQTEVDSFSTEMSQATVEAFRNAFRKQAAMTRELALALANAIEIIYSDE